MKENDDDVTDRMHREPDGVDRLVDMALDNGRPLTGSLNPIPLNARCTNPTCIGVGGYSHMWHGTPRYPHCRGSWAYNDDGTLKEDS